MTELSADVTLLLRAGDAEAGNRLIEVLYRELHDMAHRRLAGERAGSTQRGSALRRG